LIKPEYALSFLVLWGSALGITLYTGGLLAMAGILVMMLMILSHENAHYNACLKQNVKVNWIRFNWLGGMINCDFIHYNDVVPVLLAGVKNTGIYAVILAPIPWIIYNVIRPVGVNFAHNPYMGFLTSIALFAVVLFFSNISPVTIPSKEGPIMTDGWAAVKYYELQRELWNDGKYGGIRNDDTI